ncbi:hypothetical protein P9A14_22035 [Gordonia hongkongensis]|uniref:Uncharacterized protein n=1 Tax=Gordonia hongkongensis TaxID=1701090 RepID=A0AAX3T6H2_9ACTN|nr:MULTISPECIES: hypothetical protein [Gordonia]MDT0223335.1 hypothetical protein [Gordonia sp. AC31]WFP24765.1 hypothetical protein P9A14_22035 [Gordonia hongkongensis]SCC45605.1 hypothetical protein GA0061091_11622 [Gordonia sp. v-85]
MNFSRVLATIALGALAVAVVTASFFLIRSPEPSLASDAVSVDVSSQTPQIPTPQAQTPPAPAPVPQIPAGAPVQRAVPPNLNSDDDDWCDPRAAHRDDDCDDDWDDAWDDQNDDWDDQGDDWDDDIDDDQDD